jgi:hypothetical protein
MSNLAIGLVVIVQIFMAVALGLLMLRNGRNNGARYQVQSEQSHPYQLSAVNSTYTRTDLYAGIPLDAHLLELDKRALAEAYHAQLLNLWAVWLKGQAGDPQYFSNGLKIARRAYKQASEQITKREQEAEQRK